MTVTVEGDAGCHRQDVTNVCTQQRNVLLQQRAHSQYLRLGQSCERGGDRERESEEGGDRKRRGSKENKEREGERQKDNISAREKEEKQQPPSKN